MAVNVNNYTWSQLSANMGYLRDGVHGAYFTGTGKHHIWGGWTTGSTTFNNQYSSLDGITWNLDSNAPWTGRHTCAYAKVGDEIYMVNGDVFNFGNDGSYATASWKFNGTTWTQITANNGLGGYSLGSLCYLNNKFYYICGQLNINANSGRDEIWVSSDNCQSFSLLANMPFGDCQFNYGNAVVYNGKIWKIGGGIYDNSLALRTYPRRIISSSDGTNWNVECFMPYGMVGRTYSQLIVYDNAMWMIGGFHGFNGLSNIAEVWASDNGTTWTKQTVSWPNRHAATAWVGPDGLYLGWGTSDAGLKADVWKMTKNS